jgi:FtsH-binding integral membrane protein
MDDIEVGQAPAGEVGQHVDEHAPKNSEDSLAGVHRAGFVRKVYGILAAQMIVTASICACAMLVPPIRNMFLALMSIPYASLLIFIPAICVLCALQAKKAEHPTNYYLLWTFTVLMSVSIAGICAVYQKAGLGALVIQAFVITAACFIGLSLYAIKSGQNFEWMGGILSMGLMGMLMFGLLGWLFGFHGGVIYSLFGVALFCGFIVYDTHRVLRIYGPDDAIMASIELYLDILNLFLYILELLSSLSGGQE